MDQRHEIRHLPSELDGNRTSSSAFSAPPFLRGQGVCPSFGAASTISASVGNLARS